MPDAPTLIVFGASGDMARRLLFPALFSLEVRGELPALSVVGHSLEAWSGREFTSRVRRGIEAAGVRIDDRAWVRFRRRLRYHAGDVTCRTTKLGRA